MPKDHKLHGEFFFSASDVKALLKKNKMPYIRITILSVLISFAFLLCKEPLYRSEAKFKKAFDGHDVSSKFKNVLPFIAPASSQISAASIMKSRSFLQDVCSAMGLQAHVQEKGFIAATVSHAVANIKAELARKHPVKERFIFSNVHFLEQQSLKLFIRPLSPRSFEILSLCGEVVASGALGQMVRVSSGDFVVEHIPSAAIIGKKYPLTIYPVDSVVKQVQKRFYVKEDKSDKDVLVLSALFSDPILASEFLDYVMKRHVEYVKEESASVLQDHLEYFEGRKKDLENQYTQFLQEHVAYLKNSLEEDGFMGLRQEVAALEKPSEEYHTKLYEVELELSRLAPLVAVKAKEEKNRNNQSEQSQKTRSTPPMSTAEQGSLSLYEKMGMDLLHKEEKRDQAKHSLMAQRESQQMSELCRISELRAETLLLLQKCSAEEEGACDTTFSVGMSASLKNVLQGASNKQLMQRNLTDFLHELDVHEKTLLSPSQGAAGLALELEGLTPENAQQLYLDYNRELDAVYLNIKQLCYLKEQIYDPEIELSSLCNLLTDPVSQQMIQKAAQMALELRDDSNRSLKEHERIKDSLSLQKSFLCHHLAQMIHLQKMRARLIEDKISSLQKSSMHLLSTEKKLIHERLEALRSKMSCSLPVKWKMENQLQLKKELFIRMIEGIAHLEESKRVDQNILPSSYKVLDSALRPQLAQRPGLILYPSLLSISTFLTLIAIGIFRRAHLGSPVSLELLTHLEIDCAGVISSDLDADLGQLGQRDLETLRKMTYFVRKSHKKNLGCLLSLLGSYPACSAAHLASLLGMQGSKVLLIDALFSPVVCQEEAKGLLTFLKGDLPFPPIQGRGYYDQIFSGGYEKNYLELLFQPSFSFFLEEIKKKYDFVIVHSQASASSTEALLYQSLCDTCIICSGFDDSIEYFEPFLSWQKTKQSPCLSFVLQKI